MRQNKPIQVKVQPAKEIREIAQDFQQPIEVLREAVANAYDADALQTTIVAYRAQDETGRSILSLDITDDGEGMNEDGLEGFFGLGFNAKPKGSKRPPIGNKGHGTKIYYLAKEIWVVTRKKNADLLVAHVPKAREYVTRTQLPEPLLYMGDDADAVAKEQQLQVPDVQGTTIRLVDFTADSGRLIDVFRRVQMENYLRWFSVYGSFHHVITGKSPNAPLKLLIQGVDEDQPAPVEFGHPWPLENITDIKILKKESDRRPFNFFRKTFRSKDRFVSGGQKIDLAVLFEGKQGRLQRDTCIRQRFKSGGLYLEEERYGLWLCKDFIPIELRAEWMQDEELDIFSQLDAKRALIFVNCQGFQLTANRGSVGNSQQELLKAVHEGVKEFLNEIEDDSDLKRFAEEYEEEQHARARDKDQKAFTRRLERYNKRTYYTIKLPGKKSWGFFEPTREITLYGLLAQLEVLDKSLLTFEVIDYDDHQGIDLLVRRQMDPADLLSRDKVAYTELKHTLGADINHAFQNLHAIICWTSDVIDGGSVTDVTGESFMLQENRSNGTTHTILNSRPGSRYSHHVRVVILKRLLQEKRDLQMKPHPRPIKK